ncbi:hypothetical protein FQZ97_1270640 [compost metagenome]
MKAAGERLSAFAAGTQLPCHGVASDAEPGRGFGAAAVGQLQRDLEQCAVEPLARLGMQ